MLDCHFLDAMERAVRYEDAEERKRMMGMISYCVDTLHKFEKGGIRRGRSKSF